MKLFSCPGQFSLNSEVGGGVLGGGHDLVGAVLGAGRGLGLGGGFGLGGPVGVDPQLLGQVHVARFRDPGPPAAQPRQAGGPPAVCPSLQRKTTEEEQHTNTTEKKVFIWHSSPIPRSHITPHFTLILAHPQQYKQNIQAFAETCTT